MLEGMNSQQTGSPVRNQLTRGKSLSLGTKLTAAVGIATCAILVITIWFSYSQARAALEQQSNAEALKQVQSTVDQFDAYLDRVAVLPRAIAARNEEAGGKMASDMGPFLSKLLERVPPEEAFSTYLAKEGVTTGPDAMPWVDRNSFPKMLEPTGGPRDRSKDSMPSAVPQS